MWTRFSDMHSGGGTKLPPYEDIYIELPAKEAKKYFKKTFGRKWKNITCSCCGEDYVFYEGEVLEKLSEYHRTKYSEKGSYRLSLEEYKAQDTVLMISTGQLDSYVYSR